MRIYIDPYLLQLPQVRSITPHICDGTQFYPIDHGSPPDDSWALAWGHPLRGRRFAVAETGFFWDAMHIDTQGLYQFSSLNTVKARIEIDDFEPPMSAREIIEQAPIPKSKYRQPNEECDWSGVVFASQNPTDRSVHSVASTSDWWRFYEDSCRYYGTRLFVKLHPWNRGEVESRLRTIAITHGCQIGYVNHSVINLCDHVVLFTSSFSVDCMLRGVSVKQGAPGYFSQTGAVTDCAGDPTRPIQDTAAEAEKLVNFLVWKYCFSMDCTLDEWKARLLLVAHSRQLFPTPIEMSYGAYLQSKYLTP